MNLNCVATCLMGMESMVKNELNIIGASDVRAENARVYFTADEHIFVRALLNSRYAQRILIYIKSFKAETFDDLYEGVKSVDWEDYINKDDSFPIRGHCNNSKLQSVVSCRSIIKKAVCEKLNLKYNISWFKQTGPMKLIRFMMLNDTVSLMIDACGDGLYKRNYRRNYVSAPIKETLAAGLNDLVRVYEDNTLIDPFCGSGTVLIEGAMKALNIAPGLNRMFLSQTWGLFDRKLWKDEAELAKTKENPGTDFKAYGYDVDELSLNVAKKNIRKAGLEKYIKLEKRSIENFKNEDENAVVVTNPPYGYRLNDRTYASKLYRVMGETFRKNKVKRVCVITPEENFEKIYGKTADKRRKLYNGNIKCTAYAYYK